MPCWPHHCSGVIQCAAQCGVDLTTQGDSLERSNRAGRNKSIRLRRTKRNIDEVLLVGGATRMPAVRRFVENMTVRLPSHLTSKKIRS